jgi:hypothetical protein
MATIGELTNVPEPGAGVTSPWAQDTTNRIVHRFASFAALNAWAAGDGAQAVVAPASNQYGSLSYRRVAGVWVLENPELVTVGAQGSGTFTSAQGCTVWNFTLPAAAWPRMVTLSAICYITGPAGAQANLALFLNGTKLNASLIGINMSAVVPPYSASVAANTAIVVKGQVQCNMDNSLIYADPATNMLCYRIDNIFAPASPLTPGAVGPGPH